MENASAGNQGRARGKSKAMNLRDYQIRHIDSVLEKWKEHVSTLGVGATGTGKTVEFAGVAKRLLPLRTMIIVHREELAFQARDEIKAWSGIDADIEMGDLKASENYLHRSPIVISTIQTLNAGRNGYLRMHKFNPQEFACLIIDEAHHAPANTYVRTVNYFKQNPALRILGVSASPDRADEKALGQIFESVAFVYEIIDAINDGWLVPIDQQFVHIQGLDFSHMRITAGDLNGKDLAKVMEEERILQGMVGSAIEIVKDKPFLMFTASVRQAEMACEIFNRHRARMARWACGDTMNQDRRDILKDFKDGKIQGLVNCGLWGEGANLPNIEYIIMARPTCSRCLYCQQAGRGTRPLPGIVDGLATAEERKRAIAESAKSSLKLVDYVGVSGRLKLMSGADILGGNYPDEVVEKAIVEAKKSEGPIRISIALEDAEKAIEKAKAEKERRRLEWEARKNVVAKVTFKTESVDPFDLLQIHERRERGWDKGKQLSQKQKDYLAKNGINWELYSASKGKQIIDELFKRMNEGKCTYKQARLLKQHGYNPLNYTFKAASEMIGKILSGQKPEEPVGPPPPKLNGEPATDKQKKFLRHYDTSRMTKKEAKRLFLRIKQNGYRPLPLADRDHPRNWKEPVELGEVEVEPEPELVVQEDMF